MDINALAEVTASIPACNLRHWESAVSSVLSFALESPAAEEYAYDWLWDTAQVLQERDVSVTPLHVMPIPGEGPEKYLQRCHNAEYPPQRRRVRSGPPEPERSDPEAIYHPETRQKALKRKKRKDNAN